MCPEKSAAALLSNSQQFCCSGSLRSSCVVFNPLLTRVGSSISSSLGVLGTRPENSLPAPNLPLCLQSPGFGSSSTGCPTASGLRGLGIQPISNKWVQVLWGPQNTAAQRNMHLSGLVFISVHHQAQAFNISQESAKNPWFLLPGCGLQLASPWRGEGLSSSTAASCLTWMVLFGNFPPSLTYKQAAPCREDG